MLFVKASFVPTFPCCLANRGTAASIDDIPTKEPFGNPDFVLLYIFGNIIRPKAESYDPPSDFCHWALEENVINCFSLMAEVAGWIPRPMPAYQIIFGKNGIILNQPHENFNFIGYFGFPYVPEMFSRVLFGEEVIH